MNKKLVVMVDDNPIEFEGKYIKSGNDLEYSLIPLKERFLKVCGNSSCDLEFKFFSYWWKAFLSLRDCWSTYSEIFFILDVKGESELSTIETKERDAWILQQLNTCGIIADKIDDLEKEILFFAEGLAFLIWIIVSEKLTTSF